MPFPLIRPALFAMEPERAHRLTIAALARWGNLGAPFAPAATLPDRPVSVAGIRFPNALGLAAGMDKDAEAVDGLLALGFGHVEVGTLTLRPQSGNPRPRLFRLKADQAIVNRMGFNNGGLAAGLARAGRARRRGVLGINVGANKDSTDRIADYAAGVRAAAPVADYVTINISSPNTPGLRDLQEPAMLAELLSACSSARTTDTGRRPLFLKIAPDLDRRQIEAVVGTAIDGGVDALIVSNTTISRPETLRSPSAREGGGLSGAPLAALARAKLAEVRSASGDVVPLISVGGIDSADEAKRRLDAGASLVQLYTALVYHGPALAARVVRELAAMP
ncbi:quinone-dependent dihydroorotate dehydrogenase [Stakelama saccharophila]|uniref:Dihydroorotate dehydrogenase (quinone) n=1 Tax=Stakelama saccharophila TaxID=3075605 RepID=A0ABZ0BB35_9SPHN|nr:quinone-dependent dihydroorotate dehydrogenase [Stakelama sp. W311]WNO54480.1 quinone-dependent dihydroorotate dehydrogenase [Stakelama sp. W311]